MKGAPKTDATARQEARLAAHGADFQEAVGKLDEAYREGLKAFCLWVAEAWQLDDPDDWLQNKVRGLSPEEAYNEGWNAAVEGLDGALAVFLEEYWS